MTTSGSVTFDMPVDWEKVDHQDVEITPKSTLIGDEQTDDGDSDTPEDIWTFTGLAVICSSGYYVFKRELDLKSLKGKINLPKY